MLYNSKLNKFRIKIIDITITIFNNNYIMILDSVVKVSAKKTNLYLKVLTSIDHGPVSK